MNPSFRRDLARSEKNARESKICFMFYVPLSVEKWEKLPEKKKKEKRKKEKGKNLGVFL